MKMLSVLLCLAAVVGGLAGEGVARAPEARAIIEGVLGAGVAAHFGTGP